MYYNGDKILNNPQPFNFSLGARGIGKSYYWLRFCVRRFLKNKEQFIYTRRYLSDLIKVMNTLFDSVKNEFPDTVITIDKNIIYINEEIAGWCIAVSEFTKYKSSNFGHVNTILFDEFLPEDGKYLGGKQNPNLEPELCLNFYQTVARDYGKVIRDDVMFIFIANSVTINNPYFYYFNVDKQIKSNTKFLRGKGFNVELVKNKSIADEISDSKFGELIKGSKYEEYALGNEFYLDSNEFIRKYDGKKSYIMTLLYNKIFYGLWKTKDGIYYLSEKYEKNCKNIYSLNSKDHSEKSILITRINSMFIKDLVKAYASGRLYFENQRCKNFYENAINK